MTRKVVLTGSFQNLILDTNVWDPCADGTTMEYKGEDIYTFTVKNMLAGNYEYKVAVNSWNENYGVNGEPNGSNMQLFLHQNTDVTFYYNDKSHCFTDSTKFWPLIGEDKPKLVGLEEEYVLEDLRLKGMYMIELELPKGEYSNLKLVVRGKEIELDSFKIDEDTKVTFGYDSLSGLYFNSALEEIIDTETIYYDSRNLQYKYPFGAVEENTEVNFWINTAKDDLDSVKLIIITQDETKVIDMKLCEVNETYEKWNGSFITGKPGIYRYYFVVSNRSEIKYYGDSDGFQGKGKCDNLWNTKPYYLTVYDKNFTTPDWMKNSVVYQVFPDRFFKSETNECKVKYSRGFNQYEYYKDWYAIPENPAIENRPDYKGTRGNKIWANQIYGGDLKGILKKLDYLQALGINVIYLNPISKSISSHRYDTTSYKEVDPLLGDIKDFEKLAQEVNRRGMHIILDGVFNHVSDDSVYFDRYGKYVKKGKPLGAYQYWSKVYDLMNSKKISQNDAQKEVEKGYKDIGIKDFHYKDWFQVKNENVNGVYKYEGWYGYDSMPRIYPLYGSQHNIKSWADEIIDGDDANSKFWIKKGANGWRLDAAEQIADDTWKHFREAVKGAGCDNAIIGEIWTDATKYLLGDMYDSVINYRFADVALGFVCGYDLGNRNVDGIRTVRQLEVVREQYPEEAFRVMINLIDSHDTQRAISAIDGYRKGQKDVAKNPSDRAYKCMELLALFQISYPGVPCLYYGDEAGLPGADDPDNRRTMPWGKGKKELVEKYAFYLNMRKKYEVFRNGYLKWIYTSCDLISFCRDNGKEKAIVVLNRGEEVKDFELDVSEVIFKENILIDAFTNKIYDIKDKKIKIDIPKVTGMVLVTKYKRVNVEYDKLKDVYDSSFIIQVEN